MTHLFSEGGSVPYITTQVSSLCISLCMRCKLLIHNTIVRVLPQSCDVTAILVFKWQITFLTIEIIDTTAALLFGRKYRMWYIELATWNVLSLLPFSYIYFFLLLLWIILQHEVFNETLPIRTSRIYGLHDRKKRVFECVDPSSLSSLNIFQLFWSTCNSATSRHSRNGKSDLQSLSTKSLSLEQTATFRL